MDCPNFLDSYSDFRDGLITDPRLLQRLRRHLGSCASCARYDASVRHGIRALGEVEPSPDFRERLRERIAATAGQPMAPAGPGATGVAAGLMLAAAVALLVYERSNRADEAPPAQAVVLAPAPVAVDSAPLRRAAPAHVMPLVVVNPGLPFVVFTDLSVSPFRTAGGPEFHVQPGGSLGTWVNLPR